jgi:hypothetical protein
MINVKTVRSLGIFGASFLLVWWIFPAQQPLGATVPGGPGFISIGYPAFQTQSFTVPYGHINGRL